MRIGQGFDVHQLVAGRRLILGGVEVPHERGLLGHSDADVLIHAIIDALLGAIGAGDIGGHFPDHDPRYKDADSMRLMEHVLSLVKTAGFDPVNLDATIIAQRPKLAGYILEMRKNIANVLNIPFEQVNVKATTTEMLGFTGRGEGIAAMAVVLLEKASLQEAGC
jgi:2-C-methyl-D-erythritol 2,4-cyclodiphosphate synthase